jgi:hypothetical protein
MKECRVQVVDSIGVSMNKRTDVRGRICYCVGALVDKLCITQAAVDSKRLRAAMPPRGVWHVSCYI